MLISRVVEPIFAEGSGKPSFFTSVGGNRISSP